MITHNSRSTRAVLAMMCLGGIALAGRPLAAAEISTPRPKPQIDAIGALLANRSTAVPAAPLATPAVVAKVSVEVASPSRAGPRPKPRDLANRSTAEPAAPPATPAVVAKVSDEAASPSRAGPRPKPRDIAPTRILSLAQHKVFATALNAALRDDFSSALEAAEKLSDQSAKTLIEWLYVRSTSLRAGAARISLFLETHDDWPEQSVLRTRAEGSLYISPESAGATIGFFSKYPPVSGTGKIALASAYLENGDEAKAKELIVRAWQEDALSSGLERRALSLCKACITDALDKERLDRMVYRGKLAAAERAAKRLGSAHVALVKAHSAIARRAGNANTRYQQAAKRLKNDAGLSLSRITWLRRKDRDTEARKLLLGASNDPAVMLEPDAWWTERRLVARRALGNSKTTGDAYKITAGHGLSDGRTLADAEFLAGWIALRRLDDPAIALIHFERLRKAVNTPVSVARAEYWLGRAAAALNLSDKASKHYATASRHGVTYYGQLAREAVAGRGAKLDLPTINAATYEQGEAIEAESLMKAARLLSASGHRHMAARFLLHLAQRTESAGSIDRIAKAANILALPQISVRIGKNGIAKGAMVHEVAYPIVDYPEITPAPAVERALLFALTRQESEFYWQAASGAGARGLMQVMPATGKMLARQAGVAYSLKRLGEDPQYNASLGAKYIADLIADFRGSYVLAIASYNAGPGRVGQWMKMLGDPRDSEIDPIDWIETIPFDETRNYVQRVMENLQVYRARLAGKPVALKLTSDLARGSDGVKKTASKD